VLALGDEIWAVSMRQDRLCPLIWQSLLKAATASRDVSGAGAAAFANRLLGGKANPGGKLLGVYDDLCRNGQAHFGGQVRCDSSPKDSYIHAIARQRWHKHSAPKLHIGGCLASLGLGLSASRPPE